MEVVKRVREEGGEALSVQSDVTQKDQVDKMVEKAIAVFGKIDVLVNNAAGGVRQSAFMDASEDLWEENYRLNIISVLLCSQAVLKHMIPRRQGKIINISSTGEIAECIAFLASDASNYILGEIINVSGGR